MNGGVVQETGKVATSVIESLKSQPIVLALVVFNAIFVLVVAWNARDARQHQNEIMKTLLEQQKQATELLSRCIVPDRRSEEETIPLPRPRPSDEINAMKGEPT